LSRVVEKPLRIAANVRAGYVLDGKYRIERVIGVGGMGVVAAARHLELGTRVAIKLLLLGDMDAEEAIERFSREARAVSHLRSEHTVRVHDVGRAADGTPYMVMEYLVGQDLDALLAEAGTLDVSVVVGFVIHACEAIAEAHSLGIIHRDLKPRNLFLTQRPDGSLLVKVLDFGIAKRVEAGESPALTKTMSVMGSPSYMSPEQMRAARDVDARTDIWSLGVCLYELLTGAVPFDGETAIAICAAAMKDEARPPDQLRADIPGGLSRVVMQCLRKDPADRFQDVAELMEALEPFAEPSESGASARVRQTLAAAISAAERVAPEASTAPASAPPPAPALAPTPGPPTVLDARRARRKRTRLLASLVAGALGIALATALTLSQRPRTPNVAATVAPAAPPLANDPAPGTPAPMVAPIASVEVLTLPPVDMPAARRPRVARAVTPEVPAPGLSTTATPPAATSAAATAAIAPDPAPVPVAPAPAPNPPAPDPPAFVVASARVLVGSASGVVGTTATNVNRGLSGLGGPATACYRNTLPRMSAPFDGTGTLHIETDEEGHVVDARLGGALAGAVGACIAAAARGRQIPNVDTGRVRADLPVTFVSR